jgi:hypothetical protein
MPETRQLNWKKMAEACGVPLPDGAAASLEALERDFAQAKSGLDWEDDMAVDFRAEAAEEAQP